MAFKDLLNTVKSETSDAIEVTKLKSKISKEKTNIKDNYKKIGEYIYKNCKEQFADSDELANYFNSIDESKKEIEIANGEISKIKTV